MSYISLYRKWRSQDFDGLVGQKHIVRTLKNAISQNRISHAYLFCGPRGTGKTSVARILAKALNCEKGPTSSPCGKCGNCTKIRDGHAVDVIEIDAASNRGIDEIRDLREKVRYAPVEGKYKVYIIDEVHMLTPEAFNALLKTLEEPPSHVIFILATTEASKVPVTIESRCQRLDFSRIPLDEVKAHLKKICGEEGFEAEENALDLIARSGEGSMRDCVSLLDQLVSYAGNKITVDNVVELLGCADESMLIEMAGAAARKDAKLLLETLRSAVDRGRSSAQITRDLVMHFRNLLFVKLKASEALELTREHLLKMEEQAELFSIEGIRGAIRALSRAELDMKWHPHARLVLEVALLELIESEAAAPRNTQNETHIAPSTDPRLSEIKEKWDTILDKVKKKSLYGYVSLHEGEPTDVTSGGKLVISFRKGYGFHKERLEEQKNKDAVEEVLKETLGKEVRIECVVDSDGRNVRPKVSVEAVKDIFEGTVVQ